MVLLPSDEVNDLPVMSPLPWEQGGWSSSLWRLLSWDVQQPDRKQNAGFLVFSESRTAGKQRLICPDFLPDPAPHSLSSLLCTS